MLDIQTTPGILHNKSIQLSISPNFILVSPAVDRSDDQSSVNFRYPIRILARPPRTIRDSSFVELVRLSGLNAHKIRQGLFTIGANYFPTESSVNTEDRLLDGLSFVCKHLEILSTLQDKAAQVNYLNQCKASLQESLPNLFPHLTAHEKFIRRARKLADFETNSRPMITANTAGWKKMYRLLSKAPNHNPRAGGFSVGDEDVDMSLRVVLGRLCSTLFIID